MLHGEDVSSILAVRRPVYEVEHSTVAQIIEGYAPSNDRSLHDLVKRHYPTDLGQCCLTFDVVMGTEFTDWFTMGRKKEGGGG